MARRAAQTIDPRTYGNYGGGYPPNQRTPQPGRGRIIDYPRYGRRGWRRWVPSWKLVLSLFVLGFLAVVVALVAAYAAVSVPVQKDPLATAQSSTVFYADGRAIGQYPGPNRRTVPLTRVPEHLRFAVLSAEDRSFYSNNGVSLRGTVRAAVNDVRGGKLQGGSTITQQYVKNYFDLRDRTLSRKAKEFFIALKINRETPKDDILESYLNAIYMGRNAYGVQAAAGAYFGKDVSKLTVSESAFLAGIINGPELYDPDDGPGSEAKAQQRWNYVLDGMVAEGWLSPDVRAQQRFPAVKKSPKRSNSRQGQVGYLMDMVSKELAARVNISQQDLETKGYRITTTFDQGMIKDLAESVKEMPKLNAKQTAKGKLRVGVATIDPKTGAVKAIYGGEDYLKQQLNDATQNIAQAGSTWKVFTLIAALQYGDEDGPMSLRSRFDGSSPQTVDGEKFRNFGGGRGEQFGTINLTTATEHSVNTVYAQLNEKIGAEKTKKAAVAAGIPRSVKMDDNIGNVLGDSSPHPIDMASAYATIAAGGIYHRPYVVSKITPIGGGAANYTVDAKGIKVFDQDVMADVTYAMEQVVRSGTATRVRDLGRPVAGKTGTASSNLSAWFVGFTPQLSTSVAIWRQDPKTNAYVPLTDVLGRSEVTGGSVPAQLWTEFMGRALKGTKELGFPDPVFGGDTYNPAPPPAPKPTATSTPDPSPTGSPTGEPTGTPTGRPTRTPKPTLPTSSTLPAVPPAPAPPAP